MPCGPRFKLKTYVGWPMCISVMLKRFAIYSQMKLRANLYIHITYFIDYCNSILYGMKDTILSDLLHIHNTAVRILTKYSDRI